MPEKSYHHGDLKHALIEAGIELINRDGEKSFSLRRIAANCGVSPAAPYSHFENKEKMLEAMRDFVTCEFTAAIQREIDSSTQTEVLSKIGQAYVMFFLKNPNYYTFIFSRQDIKINLDSASHDDFPPFALFRETARKILGGVGMSQQQISDSIISMWSLVHGITSIAIMDNVHTSEKWEDITKRILNSTPKGSCKNGK